MMHRTEHRTSRAFLLAIALGIFLTGSAAPVLAETKKPPAPKPSEAADPVGGLKNVFQESPGADGGPLYIKSDTLELNSKARVFVYKGNVELVRDDVTITATTIEGKYDAQSRLETVVCRGNVVITKGEGMRATSNRAVYNVAAATIELTEAPELFREGNALSADKVTIFIKEDRSEAEGNVRVKVIKPNEGTE